MFKTPYRSYYPLELKTYFIPPKHWHLPRRYHSRPHLHLQNQSTVCQAPRLDGDFT